jgi:aryl-alcohol dehydrogenase-like predicted oxidoreductase
MRAPASLLTMAGSRWSKNNDSPMSGTTKAHRLRENLGAAELELSDTELRDIDAAAAQIQVLGERYPEQMQKMIDR